MVFHRAVQNYVWGLSHISWVLSLWGDTKHSSRRGRGMLARSRRWAGCCPLDFPAMWTNMGGLDHPE